jgi:hypothetical protein
VLALAVADNKRLSRGASVPYEWLVRAKNRSGKTEAGLYLKFKPSSGELRLPELHGHHGPKSAGRIALVSPGPNGNDFVLTSSDRIMPGEELSFSVLSSNRQLEFERGHWSLTEDIFSDHDGGEVKGGDVKLRLATPYSSLILKILAVGAVIGALSSTLIYKSEAPREAQKINVPPAKVDIEGRLTAAINAERFPTYAQGFPSPLTKPSDELARAVASKMRNYPAEYNKPGTLLLGDSTPVQLVIKTSESQDIAPDFKGFEGEVTMATVMVAKDVSAQLAGPPDMLQITLRGDKMRTILSPVPVTWIWDVKPLKPGKANVTLEVTSYIKNGNDTEPVPIRVLQDTWVVEAHGFEWVRYQIEQIKPIQAFLAAVGTMLVGVLAWFGIKGWGKSKPDFDT